MERSFVRYPPRYEVTSCLFPTFRQGQRFSRASALVALVAAALRLWAIDFGVPLVTHPDEPTIVNPALHMVQTFDFDPHWFKYPSMIIYIEAAVIAVVHFGAHLFGFGDQTVTVADYVGGRGIMAMSSIATVVLVGLIGYRMAPRRKEFVGLTAAGLLAVSTLHVKDSHYLKPDVPTAFFATLTLWFTLNALDHNRRRSWILASATVGMAASCKYTGAEVALVPAIGLFIATGSLRAFLCRWRMVLGMAGTAVGAFLLISPFTILDVHAFLSPVVGIVFEMRHYSTGHDGAEGNNTWLWYLRELWHHGFGPTLFPLVGVGLVAEAIAWWKGDRRAALLLVFPILYYLDSSRYVVRFDRQLIPILPFLAVIGARWISQVRLPHRSIAVPSILCVVLLSAFAVQAVHPYQLDQELAKTDVRYVARDWIVSHVEPGSVIVREWHTPPVEQDGYVDIFVRSLREQPRTWYVQQRTQYLMVSSFMYQRYLDSPNQYPDYARFYQGLFAHSPVARFEPDSTHTGPVILIFRMSDVEAALW